MSDPCRGFGSSPPKRTSGFFPPGLQSATPVEDSALLGSSECVLMLKRATPVEDWALRLQGGLAPSFPQGSNLRPLSRIRLFSALRNMSSCSNERPLSRIRLFASKADFRVLSPSAPSCDPCRGFGSSDPARFITALTRSQDAAKTPQDAPKTPPGRPKPPPVRPKSTHDAPRRPAGAPQDDQTKGFRPLEDPCLSSDPTFTPS